MLPEAFVNIEWFSIFKRANTYLIFFSVYISNIVHMTRYNLNKYKQKLFRVLSNFWEYKRVWHQEVRTPVSYKTGFLSCVIKTLHLSDHGWEREREERMCV